MRKYIYLLTAVLVMVLTGCSSSYGDEESYDGEPINQVEQKTDPASCGYQNIVTDDYLLTEGEKVSYYATNYYDHGGSGCSDMWLMNFNNLGLLDPEDRKMIQVGWYKQAPTTESACENARMDVEVYQFEPYESTMISDTNCTGQWNTDACSWICIDSINGYWGNTSFSYYHWGSNLNHTVTQSADFNLKVGVRAYSQIGFWRIYGRAYVEMTVIDM